jgi:hypothetical protein
MPTKALERSWEENLWRRRVFGLTNWGIAPDLSGITVQIALTTIEHIDREHKEELEV